MNKMITFKSFVKTTDSKTQFAAIKIIEKSETFHNDFKGTTTGNNKEERILVTKGKYKMMD